MARAVCAPLGTTAAGPIESPRKRLAVQSHRPAPRPAPIPPRRPRPSTMSTHGGLTQPTTARPRRSISRLVRPARSSWTACARPAWTAPATGFLERRTSRTGTSGHRRRRARETRTREAVRRRLSQPRSARRFRGPVERSAGAHMGSGTFAPPTQSCNFPGALIAVHFQKGLCPWYKNTAPGDRPSVTPASHRRSSHSPRALHTCNFFPWRCPRP